MNPISLDSVPLISQLAAAAKETLNKPIKKAMETLRPVLIDRRTSGQYQVADAEGNIPLANRGRALGILSILRTTETPWRKVAIGARKSQKRWPAQRLRACSGSTSIYS